MMRRVRSTATAQTEFSRYSVQTNTASRLSRTLRPHLRSAFPPTDRISLSQLTYHIHFAFTAMIACSDPALLKA